MNHYHDDDDFDCEESNICMALITLVIILFLAIMGYFIYLAATYPNTMDDIHQNITNITNTTNTTY
jgi:hypothetical protein